MYIYIYSVFCIVLYYVLFHHVIWYYVYTIQYMYICKQQCIASFTCYVILCIYTLDTCYFILGMLYMCICDTSCFESWGMVEEMWRDQRCQATDYFFRARELCSNGAPLNSPWGNTEELAVWVAVPKGGMNCQEETMLIAYIRENDD